MMDRLPTKEPCWFARGEFGATANDRARDALSKHTPTKDNLNLRVGVPDDWEGCFRPHIYEGLMQDVVDTVEDVDSLV